MTSQGPEKRFRDALKRSFDATLGRGLYFWKSIPGGIHGGGWPDIYVAYQGASLFIELKAPPNAPSALQAQVINQLNRHNARSACWLTKETDNLAFLNFSDDVRLPITREGSTWDVESILALACRSK